MEVEITLKNYRCFADEQPATFTLKDGFTAFIGSNNSGKSTLLKLLFEFRDIFYKIVYSEESLITAIASKVPFNLATGTNDAEALFWNGNSRNLQVEFKFAASNTEGYRQIYPSVWRVIVIIERPQNWFRLALYTGDQPIAYQGNMSINDQYLVSGETVVADCQRFLDICRSLYNSLYIGPYRNLVNVGGLDNYFDIEIGNSFILTWRRWQTGNNRQQNKKIINLLNDIKRIFEIRELQVANSADDQTLQFTIDDQVYKLPELGAGIAQFILALGNAAIKSPSFILIDEPELHLHPSLQLDFLTTLASYASQGVLFATHSIGLARSAADQIYSVRKDEQGRSIVRSYDATPRLSEFLGELSYSGYQALGFEQVLLVEGRTEIKTFQQFLRLYKKDHQILLLSLGGTQMIAGGVEAELLELKRICPKVIAIIDSERKEKDEALSSDRQGFVDACKKADVRCYVLERRSTENYLSDNAVKQAIGPNARALSEYEDRKQVQSMWNRNENWRIASKMTRDELEGTDLGIILASL